MHTSLFLILKKHSAYIYQYIHFLTFICKKIYLDCKTKQQSVTSLRFEGVY